MDESVNLRLSLVEERAMNLLGQGIVPEMVASAVGVTTARISQLVSDPQFAARVAELRYKNLSKHNERDSKYDALEDALLEKLENQIPMMFQPMAVARVLQMVNSAKRRGASTPDSILGTKEVVSLTMPSVVLQQFNQSVTTNIHNQVIRAGDQELVTVQSVRMSEILKEQKALLIGAPNGRKPDEGNVQGAQGN